MVHMGRREGSRRWEETGEPERARKKVRFRDSFMEKILTRLGGWGQRVHHPNKLV